MRYNISRADFKAAVEKSSSIKEVIQNLGMHVNNGTYNQVKKISREFGTDLPKYDQSNHMAGLVRRNTIPFEDFFVNGTMRSGVGLRRRMVSEAGVLDRCSTDGCPVVAPEWLNKKLSLHVDHINGDRFDNRIENLRLLCPNCHTQTDTYGNSSGSKAPKKYKYCECGVRINQASSKCIPCDVRDRAAVADGTYPPVPDTVQMIKDYGFVGAGKIIGKSDNAVRKYLRRNGIDPKTLTMLQ